MDSQDISRAGPGVVAGAVLDVAYQTFKPTYSRDYGAGEGERVFQVQWETTETAPDTCWIRCNADLLTPVNE